MSKRLLAAAKVCVTLAALGWLARSIEVGAVGRALRQVDPVTLGAAALLMFCHVVVVGWRWHRIIDHLGGRWRLRDSMRWTFVGVFFNQALPSSVGGDAVRVWSLYRQGAGLGLAFGSVAIERTTGLVVMGVMVSLAALSLDPAVFDPWTRNGLLLVGPVAAVSLFALVVLGDAVSTRLPPSIASAIRGLTDGLKSFTDSRRRLLEILALAAAAAGLNLLAFILLGRALGMHLDVAACFALAGGASLLAVLPVSLGGWGVREAAMVGLLAPLGVSAVSAVAVSVLWGLMPLVVSWPAGISWWVGRGAATRAGPHADASPSAPNGTLG
jgi:glycosyltransferase 2 family protein